MKKLESIIIKKVYRIETKRTASYILTRIFLGLLFLFLTFIFSSVTFDILNEQSSFDLLDFFNDDLDVVKRYLTSNLINFYQEMPQPLTYFLIISILLLLVVVFLFVKNFKKIKNKLISLYKFYKSK